jgi:hypothetical protein
MTERFPHQHRQKSRHVSEIVSRNHRPMDKRSKSHDPLGVRHHPLGRDRSSQRQIVTGGQDRARIRL